MINLWGHETKDQGHRKLKFKLEPDGCIIFDPFGSSSFSYISICFHKVVYMNKSRNVEISEGWNYNSTAFKEKLKG